MTKLGGTIVKDGLTTVHETNVIGTYINGKYAQVLQSSSKILNNEANRIKPSSSQRILKTIGPQQVKSKLHQQSDQSSNNEEQLNLNESPAGEKLFLLAIYL